VRANDQHVPTTRVLCIEQTHNKCGGRVLPNEYVDKCGEVGRGLHVALHDAHWSALYREPMTCASASSWSNRCRRLLCGPSLTIAREHGIQLHIDGARIWNAAAALGCSPARCVQAADSVSVGGLYKS
jgi:threonine aldolase